MLDRVAAGTIVREANSGRTRPLIVVCNSPGERPAKVVCKISDGCDEGAISLAKEVVAACIAIELGLPVPLPCLVDLGVEPGLAARHEGTARRLQASSPVAFGSTYVTSPFVTWRPGFKITAGMFPIALAALVFDAVIGNPDRRVGNPNCLVAGEQLWLIDHELAFPRFVIGGPRLPWKTGGLRWLGAAGGHIFYEHFKRQSSDLELGAVRDSWAALSDRRLQRISAAIPAEWSDAAESVEHVLSGVRLVRDNIDGLIAEVQRVLT